MSVFSEFTTSTAAYTALPRNFAVCDYPSNLLTSPTTPYPGNPNPRRDRVVTVWPQPLVGVKCGATLYSLYQCFQTFSDLLPKIAPRRWVVTSISRHARTTIFISVAHPMKGEQMINYRLINNCNVRVVINYSDGWACFSRGSFSIPVL